MNTPEIIGKYVSESEVPSPSPNWRTDRWADIFNQIPEGKALLVDGSDRKQPKIETIIAALRRAKKLGLVNERLYTVLRTSAANEKFLYIVNPSKE